MGIQYKQLCKICNKNMVLISGGRQFPVCYDCQKREMEGEIKDPEMKKMFDIPEEFYKENSFLRSVKIYYLRHNSLSEKQIETFKKATEDLKKRK